MAEPFVGTLRSMDVRLNKSFGFKVRCVKEGVFQLFFVNPLYLCVSAEFETLCGVLKRLSCPEDKLFLCIKLVLLKSLCLLQSSLDSFSF